MPFVLCLRDFRTGFYKFPRASGWINRYGPWSGVTLQPIQDQRKRALFTWTSSAFFRCPGQKWESGISLDLIQKKDVVSFQGNQVLPVGPVECP